MKRRILVADDDESVRKMIGRVLEAEDYELLLAGTDGEAMSQALRSSPDLVLLDVGMPNTSGWEAFELIYRLQPSVPVIAITSRVDRHEDALRARTGALLEKPFELADLLKVIRDVLEKSDLHRAQRDRKPDGPASVRCG